MKNILLLALALLAAPAVRADQTITRTATDEELAFNIPQSKNGEGGDSFAKWAKARIAVREFTTSASNPQDGVNLIDGACVTSTSTAGGYLSIFDTDESASITGGSAAFPLLARIAAKVIATTQTDTAKSECVWFPVPIPTSNGIGLKNSDANMTSSVIYRRIRF